MKKYDTEKRLIFPELLDGAIRLKMYLDEFPGVPVQDIWVDINKVEAASLENVFYATQKPESLLERILSASSQPRRPCRRFLLWLRHHPRRRRKARPQVDRLRSRQIRHPHHAQATDRRPARTEGGRPSPTAPSKSSTSASTSGSISSASIRPCPKQSSAASSRKEGDYLALILSGLPRRTGRPVAAVPRPKGEALVLVGPVNLPVTRVLVRGGHVERRKQMGIIESTVSASSSRWACSRNCSTRRGQGHRFALNYIPKEVFDKRAVEKNQVVFHDVADLEARVKIKGQEVTVTLDRLSVLLLARTTPMVWRSNARRAAQGDGRAGQIVKVTKDKTGVVKREVLTKKWTDWIDYWAVDFDFSEGGSPHASRCPMRPGAWSNAGPNGRAVIFSRTSGRASARRRIARWN